MKRVQVVVTVDVTDDEYSSSEHLRRAETMVHHAVQRLPGLVSVEWIGSEDTPEPQPAGQEVG